MDLWDIYQQDLIDDAKYDAQFARQDAARTADRLQNEAQRLDAKIDRLALICQAMLELVGERLGIKDKDIEERITAIDLRDGRADGNITGRPVKCRQCNRPGHTRNRVCLYCGTPIVDGHLAEKP